MKMFQIFIMKSSLEIYTFMLILLKLINVYCYLMLEFKKIINILYCVFKLLLKYYKMEKIQTKVNKLIFSKITKLREIVQTETECESIFKK